MKGKRRSSGWSVTGAGYKGLKGNEPVRELFTMTFRRHAMHCAGCAKRAELRYSNLSVPVQCDGTATEAFYRCFKARFKTGTRNVITSSCAQKQRASITTFG